MPNIKSQFIQLHVFRRKEETFEFLALKRADDLRVYPGVWQVITGTIEESETAVQTALREINEETRLKPIRMWNVPTLTTFYDHTSDTVNLSPVFAAEVDDNAIVKLSAEHQDFRWLSHEDLLELLLLPSHQEASKILMNSILKTDSKEFEIDFKLYEK